jgi:hypothetical protein
VTSQGEVIGVEHHGRARGGGEFTTRLRLRPPRQQRIRMSVPTSTTANGAVTPSSTANRITGDIDIRARWWQNDWNQSFGGLVSKGSANTAGGAYELYFRAGALEFVWHEAGGALRVVTSARFLKRTTTRPVWGRMTLKVATGTVEFFASEDGNDWRRVSTHTPVASTSIRDTTADLEVGVRNGGTKDPLNGRLLYAEIAAGIGDSRVVRARFDPTAHAGGTAATSWVADTGETWTKRTNAVLEAW